MLDPPSLWIRAGPGGGEAGGTLKGPKRLPTRGKPVTKLPPLSLGRHRTGCHRPSRGLHRPSLVILTSLHLHSLASAPPPSYPPPGSQLLLPGLPSPLGQLKLCLLGEALAESPGEQRRPSPSPSLFPFGPKALAEILQPAYEGGVMAPPRWDRRSTCPTPPAPRRCRSAAPPPVLRIPRPPFPGCLARVTSATRSPPPPLHPRCLPGAGVPRAPRARHGHGFGGADAAPAAAAAAAASTCHPRAFRPRPLRPATRGHAELPAAVPRPLSRSAALAGETHAAPAGGPETSLVGEGLGMRFPPSGTRDGGSSEGEGVGNGASTMGLGPSGEGRAGVSSVEASAGVGCPSDGAWELLLPRRKGWGGVIL